MNLRKIIFGSLATLALGLTIGAVSVTANNIKEAKAATHTFGIIGSFSDNNWSSDKYTFTTNASGDYEAVVDLSAGVSFKIRADGAWDWKRCGTNNNSDGGVGYYQFAGNANYSTWFQADSNNAQVRTGQGGRYKFVLASDLYSVSNNYDTICSKITITKLEPHTYTLVGSFSSWSATDTSYDFVKNGAGTQATFTRKLYVGETFKIVEDHAWTTEYHFKSSGVSIAAAYTNAIKAENPSAEKPNFYVNVAGTYTITLTISNEYQVTAISFSGSFSSYKAVIGGVEHALTQDSEVATTYYVSGLTLTAGQVVSIKIDNETISDAVAQAVGNNNAKLVNTEYQVLVNASGANLYYHAYEKDFWISGIPSGGYHIIKNGNTVIQMTHGDDYDGFTQYYSDSITFAADDTFKFVDATSNSALPVVFSITKINAAGQGGKFEVDNGSIKCKTACTVQVYLKLKTSNDEVYFGNEPEAITLARAYAEDFVEKITDGACNGGFPVQATLEAAWAQQATNYSSLTAAAKGELKASSSVEIIRTFVSNYQYVLNRRGANGSGWNINDFANLGAGANRTIANALVHDSTTEAAAPVTIAVTGVITLTAVGGYFFLKKKPF